MTDKNKTRAQLRMEQRSKTQERETLTLIQESKTTLRGILVGSPELIARSIELLNEKKDKELIRLRRALISERTHRERLAAGVLPRLRSKANEVRILRQKLYGHPEKQVVADLRLPTIRNRSVEIVHPKNGLNGASVSDNQSVVVNHG